MARQNAKMWPDRAGRPIALITATRSLMLIGILWFDTGIDAILGRIIMVTLPFSIGIGIANNLLSQDGKRKSPNPPKTAIAGKTGRGGALCPMRAQRCLGRSPLEPPSRRLTKFP